MNLLIKLFKKRKYKFLLLGGVLFNYKNEQYYIGAETYMTFFKTEVSINRNDVRKVINGNYLNSDDGSQMKVQEKVIIIQKLIYELELFGCDVTVS